MIDLYSLRKLFLLFEQLTFRENHRVSSIMFDTYTNI